MYAKIFASLYQGTLRGRAHEILVFTNLLANCDSGGFVDKHFRAIAEEVGLSVEEVREAINNLEAPDPESRSHELDGARIERIDAHRVWGWRVVNFLKYRSIRDTEDRKAQNRAAQERFREKVSQGQPRSAKVSHEVRDKPRSAHAEAEAEADKNIAPASPPRARNELLDALVAIDGSNPAQVTESSWKIAAKALKGIKAVCPELTVAEIQRRCRNYRLQMPGMTISPLALEKHWAKCDIGPNGSPAHKEISVFDSL